VFFAARERVVMPPPGDMAAASLAVTLRDLIWDEIYAPIACGVTAAADRLNALQFLTIRRYLSIVFVLLVVLLLVLTLWL
jgi:hydrogenase-4 component B